MNKLFSIVLALVFFGCGDKAVDDKEEFASNGWTDEKEFLNITMNLYCSEEIDDTGVISRSCLKIDWAKCYHNLFKEEFSGQEYELLLSAQDLQMDEVPVNSFEERLNKVGELAYQECGERLTKDLLEEYFDFYKQRIFIYENLDILSKIKPSLLPQDLAGQDLSKLVSDAFFEDYEEYQVRIKSYKNSKDFNPKVYEELIDINKKVSDLAEKFK